MTSRNSYSSYFKNTFKGKSWSIALSSLLFFLTLTLPALMMMGQNTNNTALDQTEILMNFNRTCDNLTSLMNDRGVFIKIAFVIMAVIAGATAFSYLHSKTKVDFYHSFPTSRKTIFGCNIIASIIPVLIGFVANFIITIALIASFGYGQAIMIPEIYTTMLLNLLYFLTIFSVTSLCAILCGNTVISLILTGVTLFGHQVIILFSCMLKSYIYPVYYFNFEQVVKETLSLSPVTQIFNIYSLIFDVSRQETQISAIIPIIYIFITALIIVIALFCFMKRKSENSGVAIAFDKFKVPLKIYCCIILGLGFGIIFKAIVGETIWIYFGLALGIILAHVLSEITFDFSFHSILKNYKHGIAVLVVCVAVVACMNLDLTGFNTRTVKSSEIESFGVDFNEGNYYKNETKNFNKRSLVEPENVEAITEIIKVAAAFDIDSKQPTLYFDVAVNKKGLGTFTRSYQFARTTENIELCNRIRYSEEYKKETSAMFKNDISKINSANIISRTQDSKNGYQITATGKNAQMLLAAIQKDYLNLTLEQALNKIPLFVIEFESNTKNSRYYYERFPVYGCYTNTLAILKQNHNIVPESIDADAVEKIVIPGGTIDRIKDHYDKSNTDYIKDIAIGENGGDDVTITDKAIISQLLTYAMSPEVENHIERFGLEYNGTLDLRVYMKNSDDEFIIYVAAYDDTHKLLMK